MQRALTSHPFYSSLATSFTWMIGVPYLVGMEIVRILLWAYAVAADQVQPALTSVLKIFTLGFLNDLATLTFVAAVFAILSLLFPRAVWRSRIGLPLAALFYILFITILIFATVAEVAFWDEFSNRFNFIAVDYLVYTTEVLNDIVQTYPMAWIAAGIATFATFITWLQWKFVKQCVATARTYKPRLIEALLLVLLSVVVYFGINANSVEIDDDHYSTELSKNGWYGLFSAFQRNELPYDKFYLLLNEEEAFGNLHNLLAIPSEKRLAPQDQYSLARAVKPTTASSKPNVVLITVESLNANFLAKYGNLDWTPNIDKLVGKSLVFNKYYATGNRTVRGLEAESMGIPPTPGSSIVRRKNNENLYTIGSVLKQQGYDNKFVYGGYGYFDNMNYFFMNNGFDSVDQSDMSKKEITFSNAWGVADENLLDRALVEADKSHAAGKPFFSLVMTTSNHRPYTYPEGRVDIPSGTNRDGAVKYTDWAIGRFIEQAKDKPWFNNTIFIITGDHCASSAGHTELPIERYHVPLIIYAPKLVKPKEVNRIVSQMDLPATIMGLLNLPYTNRFFGTDMLKLKKERALFGTYQALGYFTPGNLVVLMPNRKVEAYDVAPDGTQTLVKPNQKLVDEAVSYYQTAYELFATGKLKE